MPTYPHIGCDVHVHECTERLETAHDLYSAYEYGMLHLDRACMERLWSTVRRSEVVEFVRHLPMMHRVHGTCYVLGGPLKWACECGDQELLDAALIGGVPGKELLRRDSMDGLSVMDRAINDGHMNVVEAISGACIEAGPPASPLIEYFWVQRACTPRMKERLLQVIEAMHVSHKHDERRCWFHVRPLGGHRTLEQPSKQEVNSMLRMGCPLASRFPRPVTVGSYAAAAT